MKYYGIIVMKIVLDYRKIELDASEIPTIQLYEKFEFREDYKKYIMKKRIEVSYEK